MKVFNVIKNKNIDELSEWLDKYCLSDNAPWYLWFDKNYCSKCDTVTEYSNELNGKCEFSWCELYDKCKYFPNLNDIPCNKQLIKLWLESEYEDIE